MSAPAPPRPRPGVNVEVSVSGLTESATLWTGRWLYSQCPSRRWRYPQGSLHAASMRLDNVLLRTQHGTYQQSQARLLGLRRQEDGSYPGVRVLPGVWSLLPRPLPQPARVWAALLYAGKGSRLTGPTAAEWLGWLWLPPDQQVYVVVDAERKVVSRDFVVVTRARQGSVMTRLGISVSGPEWILASCARTLGSRELMAVTATALQRREVTLSAIALLVTRHPHVPGARALRSCLRQLDGGAESIMEVETLALIRRLELPAPECQVWIYDDSGALVAVADFWWEGVACFYDGADHFRYAVLKADRRKRDRLEALGLQVPVITSELVASPELFRARIDAARTAAAALAATRTGQARWQAEPTCRIPSAS